VKIATDTETRLQAWVRRRKKTKKEIAEEFGISAPYLSMILSGARTPSLTVAARLEDVTGIPAREFVEVAAS